MTCKTDLIAAVAARALAGLPFNKTGKGGLYEQRERLPRTLRTLGRDKLQNLCQELIDAGKIVQCRATGSNVAQWLDVPDGPFALGDGEFAQGADIVDFPYGEVMTGWAFLAVPGFLRVPTGVQEATGGTSIVLRRLQAEDGRRSGLSFLIPAFLIRKVGPGRRKRQGLCGFAVPDSWRSEYSLGNDYSQQYQYVRCRSWIPTLSKERGRFRNRPSPAIEGQRMGAATTNRGRPLQRGPPANSA